MTIKPWDHYRTVEKVVYKASELRGLIDKLNDKANERGYETYWRGQANHEWGITSSLSRLLPTDRLTDGDLTRVERTILSGAETWVSNVAASGVRSNLDWLAVLQHHWVPTRLIDFSRDPLIATFFAAESMDDVDGRLFCVCIPRDSNKLTGESDFDIGGMTQGRVRLFEPPAKLSPRLAAQDGVFLVGKLPSTSPARSAHDGLLNGPRQLVKDEVTSIMSLPFSFRAIETRSRPKSKALESYTIRVHVDKASIRRELRMEGTGRRVLHPTRRIDHALCYPDVEGFRKYSKVWRDQLGLNRLD